MSFQQIIKQVYGIYVNHIFYAPTKWYFILSCLGLALICYFLSLRKNGRFSFRGVLRYLFPKSIICHRSTKNDLFYLLSFPIIAGLFFMPALALSTSGFAFEGVNFVLLNLIGEHQFTLPDSHWVQVGVVLAFTFAMALGADFGFYLHHWFFHKIPFLWEFHKVHHSAEVLTPLTDFRAHPVEILTYSFATGLGFGIVQGIFAYATNTQLSIFTLMGFNAFFFAYYFMGYALRHSHFWISYGPVLSHFFISPAQHQIHHSCDSKHWDKNFGGTFALWDWLFGTLYIPRKKEDLTFGLGPEENRDFLNVWSFYVKPFQINAKFVGRRVLVILMLATFLYFAVAKWIERLTG